MKFAPYLTFGGTCEEAFRYYQKHIGGEITAMFAFEGTPAEEHAPPEWKKKIMHATLDLGDGALLMGSDAPPARRETPSGFSVSIQIDDAPKAECVFVALADGGKITMPIAETFWAKRFGMCVDRFGQPWMINCA